MARAQRRAHQKAAAQGEGKKPAAGRKITARCWMAEGFPMSLQQLMPVLDVVGTANKHVLRVRTPSLAQNLCYRRYAPNLVFPFAPSVLKLYFQSYA